MKALFAPLIAGIVLSNGIQAAESPDRFVSVDGHATMTVEPDIATIRMAVSARAAEVDSARREVVEGTRRFLEFAEDQGIDDRKIRSFGLSVQPQYRWNRDEERQEFVGYVVTRQLVVELDELDKLGAVMEGAVSTGVNQVQPPELKRSDERELRRRALADATRDARANADQIARSLNARLGAARTVTSSNVVVPDPRSFRVAQMAMEADTSGADTYSTGQITIEASVSAQFDLEPE